jgi:DNA primase
MLPIRDEGGRLVGFGGRALDGEGAKYINSPEGECFAKRRILYLLDRAKGAIRSKGRAILVEGYFDAIRCHLCGFPEAVAPLGTALTEEQARLIRRFADRCLVCFDADAAGQAAALRGMGTLTEAGLDVKVVSLPEGKDPDELLSREGGVRLFEGALEAALPLPLFHLRAREADLVDPDRRAGAIHQVLDGLAELPTEQRAPYLNVIGSRLGLLAPELIEALRERTIRKKHHPDSPREKGIPGEGRVSIGEEKEEGRMSLPPDSIEAAFCALLFRDGALRGCLSPEGILPLLTDPRTRGVAAALLYGEPPEELADRWHAIGDQVSPAVLAAGEIYLEEGNLPEDTAGAIRGELSRRSLARAYRELKVKMARGEASGEDMRRYGELAARLKGGHSKG